MLTFQNVKFEMSEYSNTTFDTFKSVIFKNIMNAFLDELNK